MDESAIKQLERSLHSEKNLWQVWCESRKIPYSRFNIVVVVLVFALSALDAGISSDIPELVGFTRSAATAGVAAGLSVLGLLLAGFTVFATVSQPDLLLTMMTSEDRKSGLPRLKSNLYLFVRVFIILLLFTAICFLVLWLGRKSGLLSGVCRAAWPPLSCEVLARIGFVLVMTAHALAFVQIKSFVFNILHSVMSYLRFHSRRARKAPGSSWPPTEGQP